MQCTHKERNVKKQSAFVTDTLTLLKTNYMSNTRCKRTYGLNVTPARDD